MEPPDTSHPPSYFGETVVEILYSQHNEFRAIIAKNRQGNFHIRRERWCLDDWNFIGTGNWTEDGRGTTLTNTFETAQKLAREKLQETPDA